jgi:thiazole synthase
MSNDTLKLGKYEFKSRLLLGTGKYSTFEVMEKALEVSGAEVITVAVRRVDLSAKDNLLKHIDLKKYTLLPNTAGCYTAEDAIKYSRLGREITGHDLIKLEVLSDEKTLLPDPIETLKAVEVLVKDGFTVLAYTSDDPVMARKLEQAGVTSVMPAGSPIGSGQGVLNPNNIRIILEMVKVPVIVDAGVGTASDVALAMELGVEAVLLNSGVALAKDPVKMAAAMKYGVMAGRLAYQAGRIGKKLYAAASSPTDGMIK